MRRLLAVLALAIPALVSAPATAQTAPAAAVVEEFHASLLEAMKAGDALGPRERYAYLEPTVREAFDLERMIRAASGAHWKSASEAERAALADAFARFSVSTYASRFDRFSGQRFETLGARDGPRGTVLVETRIVPAKDAPVPITYVMRETDGHWRITNVILDRKISELAVRRSEYSKILRDGGPAKLTAELDEKARDLITP